MTPVRRVGTSALFPDLIQSHLLVDPGPPHATEVPSVTQGSRQLDMIPQTVYHLSERQGPWVMQLPIEFGDVDLTDCADPWYLGIPGRDDMVLNYNGAGSTISCRLNVR